MEPDNSLVDFVNEFLNEQVANPNPDKTSRAPITINKYGKRWSKCEDSLLKLLVGHYGESWDLISQNFMYRNKEHVINRWILLSTQEMKMSEWTPEEDAKLRQLVDKYRKKWTCISKNIPGRSGAKCRQRWRDLNEDKKRGGWSDKEINILYKVQKIMPNNWTEIVKLLPGRSITSIKAFWYSSTNEDCNSDLSSDSRSSLSKQTMLKEEDDFVPSIPSKPLLDFMTQVVGLKLTKKLEQKTSEAPFKCFGCPRTPSPFKNALAAFGIKCDGKSVAPLSPGFAEDIAEIINSERNLDNSAKLIDSLNEIKTHPRRAHRAYNSPLNINVYNIKKNTSEMFDESAKENFPMMYYQS